MRPTTVALNNRFATKTGTEPQIAIAINWGLGTTWFAGKTMTLPNGQDAYGKIVSVGSCRCDKRNDNTGTTGSVDVILDDSDGLLKTVPLDNDIIEQAGAAVYLFYADITEMLPLLVGKVAGPVVWDEGGRTLKLTIEPIVEDFPAGFVPTDEFDDLSDEAKNRPWPMVFGKCAHIPAVKVREHRSGILKYGITLESDVYEFDSGTKNLVFTDLCQVKSDLDGAPILDIKDGRKFPQGQEITISIDGVLFIGEFAEEAFTVSTANAPKYADTNFGPRIGDAFENASKYTAFVSDDKINLQGHYVYWKMTEDGPEQCNYCVKQEGKTCTFKGIFQNPTNGATLSITDSHYIAGAYKIGKSGSPQLDDIIRHVHKYFKGVAHITNVDANKGANLAKIVDLAKSHQEFFWQAAAGSKVRLWGIDDPDIYIVSLIPCLSVDAVYGRRKIKLPNKKDAQFFAPIPTEYYEVQLEADYEINGTLPTGVLFYIPLEELDEEGWTDEILITATSSVGPNAADIIEYILTTYTSLNINGTSFNDVFDLVADTPANFAIFEKKDAIEFCREIAWQSRCGIRLDSVSVDLVYLPEEPNYLMTLNETNTEFGSLEYHFTPINEIYTKFTVRWATTYKNKSNSILIQSPEFKSGFFVGSLVDDKDNDEQVSVYRNNIDKFGEREREEEIYIYNEEEFVLRTLEFWGYRYSNSWRYITLKTYMPSVIFQPWDAVTLTYTNDIISNISSMPGIVEEWSFDPETHLVAMKLWIPSQSGTFTVDNDVWE